MSGGPRAKEVTENGGAARTETESENGIGVEGTVSCFKRERN